MRKDLLGKWETKKARRGIFESYNSRKKILPEIMTENKANQQL